MAVIVLIVLYVMDMSLASRISVQYNVTEDRERNYLIGNIPRDTNLAQHFAPEIFSILSYKFLQNSPFLHYLQLDRNTGDLRIQQELDRETICSTLGISSSSCPISLYIATQPADHQTIIKVTIHVQDVNDNTPTFEQKQVQIEVSESAQPGMTQFTLPQARDPDYGMNTIQSYRLEPHIPQFDLDVVDSPVGPADLILTLTDKLDRERTDSYRLRVMAWDGGQPSSRTGTLTINIQVLDSNDNAPQFTKSVYEVKVRENQAIGSTLTFVKAIDSDHEANGEVIYTFTKSTKDAYGALFDINEDTGEIYTVGPLDYEAGSLYSLSVVASDRGPTQFQAFAKVLVTITDENDNAPVISISGLGRDGGVEIAENCDLETLVALIDVHDPEDGANSKVTCSMTSSSFLLQEIAANQYEIVTATAFNRELKSEHLITLLCQDHGFPAQVASEEITVTVTDENDNPPVFTHHQYNVSLYENAPIGQFLVRAQAIDMDIGMNAELTYSIQQMSPNSTFSPSKRLAIDSRNGTVYTIGAYDRERQSKYRYLLTAHDSGAPYQLSATATLNLNVFDVNDEPPRFSKPRFRFGIYENYPSGQEIGTVTAHDEDLPPNNRVEFRIKSTTHDSNAFVINAKTGELSTKKTLDREVVSEYRLLVIAENPGTDLQSEANVTVTVADRNDNAPRLLFPRPQNNTVNITGNIQTGDAVAQVIAKDADVAKNSALTYSISSGNDDAYFDINVSGEVFIARAIDLPNGVTTFILGITVSDRGEPPLYSTQALKVLLNGSVLPAPVEPQAKHPLISLSANTNILIVVLCSVLVVIIFTVILLFVLLAVRRRKDGPGGTGPRRSQMDRLENRGQTDATKALLARGEKNGQAGGGTSLDSGVDLPPTDDPRSGNHYMTTWGRSSHANQPSESVTPVSPPIHTPDTLLTDDDPLSPESSNQGSQGQMTEIQLRVHEMLYQLNHLPASGDRDCSSDSGRGPSEEGDTSAITKPETEELELQHLKGTPHYSTLDPWRRHQSYQPFTGSQPNSPCHGYQSNTYSGRQNRPQYSSAYNTTPHSSDRKTQACRPILKPQESLEDRKHQYIREYNPGIISPLPVSGSSDQFNTTVDNNRGASTLDNRPCLSNNNNKKKTVHFVKPYSYNTPPHENSQSHDQSGKTSSPSHPGLTGNRPLLADTYT